MSRRAGEIFFKDIRAGILEEGDEGYTFTYDSSYVNSGGQAISISLPIRIEPHISKTLFPFFDGLIPEGWLLNIAVTNWKLNQRDRMGLLLSLCEDTIGAVTIKEAIL